VITESALFHSLNYSASMREHEAPNHPVSKCKICFEMRSEWYCCQRTSQVFHKQAKTFNISSGLFRKGAIREIVLHKIIKWSPLNSFTTLICHIKSSTL